ncbi:hypothetical protein [Pyrococcus yayanosii]|uniref:Uncharacterized protein n=1 Tax=Pyrococcus yayanosii (strain CH1 / JCM 16557) TaxID=529709 RepID=F8AHZ3_PYRYC|nr:hypothetical protein [Pyrococcus yayanosii]AEH25450.1 hypothetical protein PYCH_17930 [Pyrococcus yayanosii CH1]
MIGIIASLIVGYELSNPAFLLSLLPFLVSRRSRDVGIITFLLYSLYTGKSVYVSTLYSYTTTVTSLTFALSLVLLLEDILRDGYLRRDELLPMPLILGGIIIPELLIAGGFLYLFRILDQRPYLVPLALIPVFLTFRSTFDVPGGATFQVGAIIALSFLSLILIFLRPLRSPDVWGNVKKFEEEGR